MENSPFPFFDMVIALGFVLGWGVLELVGRRLDKKRAAQQDRSDSADPDVGQRA